MAYEDFTTYDETDEGDTVTVAQSKVSWVDLDRSQDAYVSYSKGPDHFSGDFEHLFEVQNTQSEASGLVAFWGVANTQDNWQALADAGEDFVVFDAYSDHYLQLQVLENGSTNPDTCDLASVGVTFYITLARDDDGGANGTGQYTAEIRLGSHTGSLLDTLTVDCSAGEQNDFEYVFTLLSVKDEAASSLMKGFTQNLDLQEPRAGRSGPGFRPIYGANRLRGLRRNALF